MGSYGGSLTTPNSLRERVLYDCDRLSWNASAVYYAIFGGRTGHESNCGAFNLHLDSPASDAAWTLGA